LNTDLADRERITAEAAFEEGFNGDSPMPRWAGEISLADWMALIDQDSTLRQRRREELAESVGWDPTSEEREAIKGLHEAFRKRFAELIARDEIRVIYGPATARRTTRFRSQEAARIVLRLNRNEILLLGDERHRDVAYSNVGVVRADDNPWEMPGDLRRRPTMVDDIVAWGRDPSGGQQHRYSSNRDFVRAFKKAFPQYAKRKISKTSISAARKRLGWSPRK
jgi:hypothetical protein